ncbi:MAG: 2-oxoacid:acceptor oxidoreductase subunit alpha, partial [Deltaproteobacteria bacterium]
TREYMSRIRGGANSTTIRVSTRPVRSHATRIDILVPLKGEAAKRQLDRVTPDTVIIGEEDEAFTHVDCSANLCVPLSTAGEGGRQDRANIVATGVIACIFDLEREILEKQVRQIFAPKGEETVRANLEALWRGCDLGLSLVKGGKVPTVGRRKAGKPLIMNGTDAVVIGALQGGCTFLSSYPMSPSTGVLTGLSGAADRFGLLVTQVEDEISAINTALGASYAGARAMVTTSGGGFDLMTEGISLAGIGEIPVVVHLAQRPGPGTGLPTRTAQEDLLLALHGGHGEFPRVILAPGDIEEGVSLTRRAFFLAEKYQVPVIVLTDQFFVDTIYDLTQVPLEETPPRFIRETDETYRRYAITDTGVSPLGIPGWGKGLVVVDSDEHDEEGHITEDLTLRVRMVEKRLRKREGLEAESVPPSLSGDPDFETLVVHWGSTKWAVREAIDSLGTGGIASLHFSQVYPLHPLGGEIMRKARRLVLLEQNASGQFGSLLKREWGLDPHDKILRWDGLPFGYDEVAEKLNGIIQGGGR